MANLENVAELGLFSRSASLQCKILYSPEVKRRGGNLLSWTQRWTKLDSLSVRLSSTTRLMLVMAV